MLCYDIRMRDTRQRRASAMRRCYSHAIYDVAPDFARYRCAVAATPLLRQRHSCLLPLLHSRFRFARYFPFEIAAVDAADADATMRYHAPMIRQR